jgi:mannose-1-phosphate guanylyltransferase
MGNNMKTVIFAGGSGRRLWPISLKSSPKQFEPILGEKSTLQLAVDRVLPLMGGDNVYISTNQAYVGLVAGQLPELPTRNFIGEPTRRDLAAAVGLALVHLMAAGEPDEPVAILWGDNYMDQVPTFRRVLQAAEQILRSSDAEIVFMGETPRFANDNLGWIGLGASLADVDGLPVYGFDTLTYRPKPDICQQMFAAKTHVWNTGYFVTTPSYIWARYEQHQPQMAATLRQIQDAIGSEAYEETLNALYPTLSEMSFDDAILVHVPNEQARVVYAEMGWSDPGTLYALKEALNPDETANVTRGLVVSDDSADCLLYNYEEDKLLAAIGLTGMIVINTDRAILVVHKSHIPLVKKMVNGLVGTELEQYT